MKKGRKEGRRQEKEGKEGKLEVKGSRADENA